MDRYNNIIGYKKLDEMMKAGIKFYRGSLYNRTFTCNNDKHYWVRSDSWKKYFEDNEDKIAVRVVYGALFEYKMIER